MEKIEKIAEMFSLPLDSIYSFITHHIIDDIDTRVLFVYGYADDSEIYHSVIVPLYPENEWDYQVANDLVKVNLFRTGKNGGKKKILTHFLINHICLFFCILCVQVCVSFLC